MENLIGRKIKGFKFSSIHIAYVKTMNKYIGKIGKITAIQKTTLHVLFLDGKTYIYPIDQIQPHLVEEIPILGVGTLMWVWNVAENVKFKRFVIAKTKEGYLCWYNAEKEEDIDYNETLSWRNAEPITEPEYIYLTKQDICDGKGVGVEPSLIKFIE
jgi:hypothetical protein